MAVLALAITACGQDLGKANFARTTVPAAADSGSASDGPITDAAVAAEALRLIKPCQFLTKDALASLGTVADDPSASSVAFDSCRNSVKDPGGKEIRIGLELDSLVSEAFAGTTGTVGGLPLVVKGAGDSCVAAALTGRQPNRGIRLSIDYAGGDSCRVGQTLIDAVVKKVHESPEKYDAASGTLLAVDPCAALDASAVEGVEKSAKASPTAAHSCEWRNSSGPTITVTLKPGLAPIEGDGYQRVDLGSGVTGFKKLASNTNDCTVQWKHRNWAGENVEIAQVQYVNYSGKADQDDPCGKAVTLAKNALGKLPKA